MPENVLSNYFFQIAYVGVQRLAPSTRTHRCLSKHTGLKFSLEMFITVWVSVCYNRSLPLYVSSKIP